jgi:hypothetical protein
MHGERRLSDLFERFKKSADKITQCEILCKNMRLYYNFKGRLSKMGKELKYFLKNEKILIAAWPEPFGSTICFYEKEKKWRVIPDTLFQIEGEIAFEYGSSFRQASLEEAQSIFGDIPPDETLRERKNT